MPSRAFFLYLPPVIIVNMLQIQAVCEYKTSKLRIISQNAYIFIETHGKNRNVKCYYTPLHRWK